MLYVSTFTDVHWLLTIFNFWEDYNHYLGPKIVSFSQSPSLNHFSGLVKSEACLSMTTSWNGNIFHVTGPLEGESTGHLWIPPPQRPVTQNFDVFYDLRLNKQLGKQSRRRCLRRHRAHYDFTLIGYNCSSDEIWFARICTYCPYLTAIHSFHTIYGHGMDPWWRQQMETFSALLALCAGNSSVTSQSWGWWF